MGRKSLKESRQPEIVKAFYKLAKKEGLENASIAKTAAMININPSLIIHYFQTREQLVSALIEFILERYLQIFKTPSVSEEDPKKRLLTVIDKLFSQKWNMLFDDSVAYSCYSMVFRDKKVKSKFKEVLDQLRHNLEELIRNANEAGDIEVADPARAADMVFVIVDGAYYYLSLETNKAEYGKRLDYYKIQALQQLNLSAFEAA
ncbi:TetR family transcriptional regulator C-terminal domain-containing protein [Flavihumibacter sp. UBA7668]|uniref:TetR family transcriptional regulator C-terminal domain-containing protein n=1 Tax=Flavihumibacter sp. UBA7668 TaxID=1946542 RepID=UPI0025C276DE|nr:TetR family transcriptional regulator C-terminal domain-containing protein [Flavihumibacter sp. UBA7668]